VKQSIPNRWHARDGDERAVVRDSVGLGFGVGLYGVTFGALATSSGLSIWQTCLLSLLAFTGASQFAFIGVVASGGAPFAGALTSLLLGSRNVFYGISMARALDVRGWRRAGAAHLVIDESTAMGADTSDRTPATTRVLLDRHRDFRVLEPHDAGRSSCG
jgi:predicted branched-subunit amino acid permease